MEQCPIEFLGKHAREKRSRKCEKKQQTETKLCISDIYFLNVLSTSCSCKRVLYVPTRISVSPRSDVLLQVPKRPCLLNPPFPIRFYTNAPLKPVNHACILRYSSLARLYAAPASRTYLFSQKLVFTFMMISLA